MGVIDLHLHSWHSDGSFSPEEVIHRANGEGVKIAAIADHDGTGGILEAVDAGRKLGVSVLPAVELSAGFEEVEGVGGSLYVHILGYGIDPGFQPLQEAITEILAQRDQRNKKLLFALNQMGYEITAEDLALFPGQKYIGKPNFARALVKKGYAKTAKEAFSEGRFLRAPAIRALHREKIDGFRAMKLIEEAGGIAVLAHPLKISYKGKQAEKHFYDRLERILPSLIDGGLRGMECYYGRHLPYETERLLELADRLKLLVSAGSDFHGPDYDPGIVIGSYQVIPDPERFAWISGLLCN